MCSQSMLYERLGTWISQWQSAGLLGIVARPTNQSLDVEADRSTEVGSPVCWITCGTFGRNILKRVHVLRYSLFKDPVSEQKGHSRVP